MHLLRSVQPQSLKNQAIHGAHGGIHGWKCHLMHQLTHHTKLLNCSVEGLELVCLNWRLILVQVRKGVLSTVVMCVIVPWGSASDDTRVDPRAHCALRIGYALRETSYFRG